MLCIHTCTCTHAVIKSSTHSDVILGDGVREVRDGHGRHGGDPLGTGEGRRGRRGRGVMLGAIPTQRWVQAWGRRAIVPHLHL